MADKELSIIVRAKERLREGFGAAVRQLRSFRDSVKGASEDSKTMVGSLAQTGAVIAALDGATKLVQSGMALARGDAEAFNQAFSSVPVLGHAYKLGTAIREAITGELGKAKKEAEELQKQMERAARLDRVVQVLDRNADQIRDLKKQYKEQAGMAGLTGVTRERAQVNLEYERELAKLQEKQKYKAGGLHGQAVTDTEFKAALASLRRLRDARLQAIQDAQDKEAQANRKKVEDELQKIEEEQAKKAKKQQDAAREQEAKEQEIRNSARVARLRAQKRDFEADLALLNSQFEKRIALAKTATEREALIEQLAAEERVLARRHAEQADRIQTGRQSRGISGANLTSRFQGVAEIAAAKEPIKEVADGLRKLRIAQDRATKAAERTAAATERLVAEAESDIVIGAGA